MGQITAKGLFGKFNNCDITLNGVPLIDVKSLNVSREDQAMEDISASGDAVDAVFLPGRKAITAEIAFHQSIYAGENDTTIEAAQSGNVAVALTIQLEEASDVATIGNPIYTYQVFVGSYTKADAEHDASLGGSVTCQVTGALSVATT